jgi:hypothetical protein
MSDLENLKPGDVFTYSNYSDDLLDRFNIPNDHIIVYLGKKIVTNTIVDVLDYNTTTGESSISQVSGRVFLADLKSNRARNKRTKIPLTLLEDISVPTEKENLKTLEKKYHVELPDELRNMIIDKLKNGDTPTPHFPEKTRKIRKTHTKTPTPRGGSRKSRKQ